MRTELNLVRTNLPSAKVTSYTYKHPVGVSSITDPNNNTNTYEYDAFNRLVLIKDQDGNVVKKNEYSYATPDPAAEITVFYSQALSQSFTCNACYQDFSGPSMLYSIRAGKYYSLVSQAAADALAAGDMLLNGQEYVDKVGVCVNTNCRNCTNCDGVNKKCINGSCETGWRINTSSIRNKFTNQWTCTYHYYWFADGSISGDYTEVSGSPCTIAEP